MGSLQNKFLELRRDSFSTSFAHDEGEEVQKRFATVNHFQNHFRFTLLLLPEIACLGLVILVETTLLLNYPSQNTCANMLSASQYHASCSDKVVEVERFYRWLESKFQRNPSWTYSDPVLVR